MAVVSLIERGLLETDGDMVVLADRDAAAKVRHNLDKTVLMVLAADGDARKLQSHSLAQREADLYGPPLQRLGLLPDQDCRRASQVLAFASVLFLWVVAGTKIFVALSRGHANLAFLVILSIITPLVLIAVTHPRLTGLGQRTCRCLRNLFAGLRGRSKTLQLSKTTSELTFLAAVFGMVALPAAVSLVLKPLHLLPQSGGAGAAQARPAGAGVVVAVEDAGADVVDAVETSEQTTAPDAEAGGLSDHVIICGLGHVGYRIALILTRLGRRGTIIAREVRKDWQAAVESHFTVIVGDAREDELLCQAGIRQAQAILAVTNDDLANVSIALDAQRLNPRIAVTVRVFDQNLAAHLEKTIQIQRALSASALAVPAFAAAALGGTVEGVFETDDTHWILESEELPRTGAESVAFRSAKDAGFRGAKGDDCGLRNPCAHRPGARARTCHPAGRRRQVRGGRPPDVPRPLPRATTPPRRFFGARPVARPRRGPCSPACANGGTKRPWHSASRSWSWRS